MLIDVEIICHAIIGQNVSAVGHGAQFPGGSSVRYDGAASPHPQAVIVRANRSIGPSSLEYGGFNPVFFSCRYRKIN